jgi:hypothetical protein
MTREIFTKKGQAIFVDDEDFEELNALTWYVDSETGYAARNMRTSEGKKRKEYMHRRLLGLDFGDPRFGDHDNENRLDNQRLNLRICDKSGNMRNRGAQRNSASGVKGVHWSEERQRWVAAIKYGGKQRGLGRFKTLEEAREAYRVAAEKHHGEFANCGGA